MSPNQLDMSAVTNSALNSTRGTHGVENLQASHASSPSDAQQFAQSLAKFKDNGVSQVSNVSSADQSNSLGARVMSNVAELSSRLAEEQKKVSAMIEKATKTNDSFLMMNAMHALSTYNQHAQMATKTVAKAATGLETLTRLQ